MSVSAWMPMYWGDYLRDTRHLSAAEHGAYLLLIAHYWTTGEPLPSEPRRLCRIASMLEAEWKDAASTVLAFFELVDGRYVHRRVEDELVAAAKKKDKYNQRAKTAASARWNAARNASGDASSMHDAVLGQCPPQPQPPEESSLRSDSPSPQSDDAGPTEPEMIHPGGTVVWSPTVQADGSQPALPAVPAAPRPLTKAEREAADVDQAFRLYNITAERCGLNFAQKLTGARAGKIKGRLRDSGGLDGWRAALAKVEASDYLCNRGGVGFLADLDFILQESSFVKLIEGRYDNRRSHGGSGGNGGWLYAGQSVAEHFRKIEQGAANPHGGPAETSDDESLPF